MPTACFQVRSVGTGVKSGWILWLNSGIAAASVRNPKRHSQTNTNVGAESTATTSVKQRRIPFTPRPADTLTSYRNLKRPSCSWNRRLQLRATSAALTALKREMLTLAEQLPEYPVVMGMFGVGPTLGPQLIAEIGDVRRFYSKKALVAYAGLDAPPNDSGDVTGRHKSMSKVGASSLRRTLFLVMSVYLQNAPLDEPIYQFMDRKRAEGKPYRVYMMASANKFLRIYYATVKAYLESLEHTA